MQLAPSMRKLLACALCAACGDPRVPPPRSPWIEHQTIVQSHDPTLPVWTPATCAVYRDEVAKLETCDEMPDGVRDRLAARYHQDLHDWQGRNHQSHAQLGEIVALCRAGSRVVDAELRRRACH
jgi:hypothetical protein